MAQVLRAVFFDLGGTLWSPFGDKGKDRVVQEAAFRAASAVLGMQFGPSDLQRRDVPLGFAQGKDAEMRDLAGLLISRLDALTMVRQTAAEFSFAEPVFREEDLERIVRESTGLRDESQVVSIAETFGDDLTKHYRLYPETVPVLTGIEANHPGLTTGIVSNTVIRPRIIDRYLAESGLDTLVDFRVLSSEVGWRKPHPAIYAAALARAGVKPEEALFVGDRPVEDVAGPRRLGIRAILIAEDGVTQDFPAGCEPVAVVRDLGGVTDYLARVLA